MSVNNDGTLDLISDKPTSEPIRLSGAVGYNNAVYLLDEASSKLYSNSELATEARNIKVEDYEEKMNSAGKSAINNFNENGASMKYGETRYTGKFWSGPLNRETYPYYPVLYAQEKGSGINSTSVRQDGAERSDKYYTSPTTQGAQVTTSGLTATQTGYVINATELNGYFDDEEFYNLIFNVGDFVFSSRYSYLQKASSTFSYDQISWGLYIYLNNKISCNLLYNSDPYSYTQGKPIRPVVTLNTNVQIFGGDGTEEHPYKLSV